MHVKIVDVLMLLIQLVNWIVQLIYLHVDLMELYV